MCCQLPDLFDSFFTYFISSSLCCIACRHVHVFKEHIHFYHWYSYLNQTIKEFHYKNRQILKKMIQNVSIDLVFVQRKHTD